MPGTYGWRGWRRHCGEDSAGKLATYLANAEEYIDSYGMHTGYAAPEERSMLDGSYYKKQNLLEGIEELTLHTNGSGKGEIALIGLPPTTYVVHEIPVSLSYRAAWTVAPQFNTDITINGDMDIAANTCTPNGSSQFGKLAVSKTLKGKIRA